MRFSIYSNYRITVQLLIFACSTLRGSGPLSRMSVMVCVSANFLRLSCYFIVGKLVVHCKRLVRARMCPDKQHRDICCGFQLCTDYNVARV